MLIMGSIIGLRAYKASREKNAKSNTNNSLPKAAIPRSMDNVNHPFPGDEEDYARIWQTPGRSATTSLDEPRSDMMNRISIHRRASDEINRMSTLSSLSLTRSNSNPRNRPDDKRLRAPHLVRQSDVSSLYTVSSHAPSIGSSISLDIPALGPTFNLDDFLRDANSEFDLPNLKEEPAEDLAEGLAEDSAEDSEEDSEEDPAEESVEESVVRSTEELTEESTEESGEESTEEPTEEKEVVSAETTPSPSISSSPEMWEPKNNHSSLGSSHSSLPSNTSIANSSEAKRAESSRTSLSTLSENADISHQKKDTQTEAERARILRNKKQIKQDFKLKPLPPAPSMLHAPKKHRDEDGPLHIAALASKYSPRYSPQPSPTPSSNYSPNHSPAPSPKLAESPVDKLIFFKPGDKTLTEATNDLERELGMLVDVDANTTLTRPRSFETTSEGAVAQSHASFKPKRSPNPKEGAFKRPSSDSQKHLGIHPAFKQQQQSYKAFPPPIKSPPLKKEEITDPKPLKSKSKSFSSDPEQLGKPSSTRNSLPNSQATAQSSRFKIKSSVHMPNLRKQKSGHNIETRHDAGSKASAVKLQDEQAAVARSTDRYIDAEIAKALNVQIEEGEEDSDAQYVSEDEGDWSAIYPLKAVKKLGIPLMTSSHIPRLSYSESEREPRPQLPKLVTSSPNPAIQRIAKSLETPSADRKYPETPDDILPGSFIIDSSPVQTPLEEKDPFANDTSLDSHKIFIGFDRIELAKVPEEMSPKTREVPPLIRPSDMPAGRANRPQSVVYELAEHGSAPTDHMPQLLEDVTLSLPSCVPDEVISALMLNVNNLDELFNYAQVNKQFYRVFKKDELSYIKNALFNMNPPAWELREMSPPWSDDLTGVKDPDAPVPQYTPSSYLRHYARDIFALAKLKTLIFSRCSSFMRPETAVGLTGHDNARASEIDEAFWRIWTFCRIFGCGKGREGDINGQMDWLNAGYLAKRRSKAGAAVITAEPFFSANNVLFDPPAGFGMGNANGLTCSQLYDMTEIWNCLGTLVQEFHHECKEARVAGIFNGLDIAVGDVSAEEPVLEEWTHYLLTLGPSALVGLSSMFPGSTVNVRQQFAKANQMGMTKWEVPEGGCSRKSFLREAISRTYERRLADHPKQVAEAPSYTSQPRVTGRANGSEAVTGPVAPPYIADKTEDHASAAPPPPPRYSATFLDPVDRAIHRIVHDLGFSEHDAKWALKITDTGDMIDTNAAIQLLLKERRKRTSSEMHNQVERNNCLVDTAKHRGAVAWQFS